MAIFGVLTAIAVGALYTWRDAQAEKGTVRELLSSLRNVQGRAVSESTTFCVDFGGATSTSFTVYRTPGAGTGALSTSFACSSGTAVLGPVKTEPKTSLTGINFDQRNGLTTTFILFYPRGAASPGSINIGRQGSAKTYSVTIDGLTGRVSSPDGH